MASYAQAAGVPRRTNRVSRCRRRQLGGEVRQVGINRRTACHAERLVGIMLSPSTWRKKVRQSADSKLTLYRSFSEPHSDYLANLFTTVG